jgi:hypothetical protein
LLKFVKIFNVLKNLHESYDNSAALREIDLPGGKRGMRWRIGSLLANMLLIVFWTFLTYEAAGQRMVFYIESYGEDAIDMISRQRLLVGSVFLFMMNLLFAYLIYRGAHRSLGLPRTALKDGLFHATRLGLEPFMGLLSFVVVSIGSIGFLSDLPEGRLLGLLIGATAILGGLALNLISPIVVATSKSGIQRWPLGLWLPFMRMYSQGTFSRVEVVEIRRNGYTSAFRLKAISVHGTTPITVGVVPAAMGREVAEETALCWAKTIC